MPASSHTRRVHVLERVGTQPPQARLSQLVRTYAASAGRALPVTDVQAALALHATRDDVPPETPEAIEDLRESIRRGEELIQYVIEIEAPSACVVRDPLPADTPLLGARRIAGLLAISKHSVYPAFERGLLRLVESAWKGALQRYAIVDERMAAWCSQYERWVAFDQLQVPATNAGRAWLDEHDIERSPVRTRGDAVYAGYAWLEYVATRPEALRGSARILAHQVT